MVCWCEAIHKYHLTKRPRSRYQPEEDRCYIVECLYHEYNSLVGSECFLVDRTRPDPFHTVGVLGRFAHNPGPAHIEAAQLVIRYLTSTQLVGLLFRGSDPSTSSPTLVGYSDSDFAGDPTTRKSTSGSIFTLASAPIS